MSSARERLRAEGAGEYMTEDGRYLISRADNGSWYLFETARIGGDSIFFGPTLRAVRDWLARLRRAPVPTDAPRSGLRSRPHSVHIRRP
jgi:hypothetical protein